MKLFYRVYLVAVVLIMIFCMAGCEKSEEEYKRIISSHLRQHGGSDVSFDYFYISDSGAKGRARASLGTDFGGMMDMSVEVEVDKEGNIVSCWWCDLFGKPNT